MRVADHVFALIAVCRDGSSRPEQLGIAGIKGGGEEVELGAGVVDIELPLHRVAGGREHIGQAVAQRGVARAAIVDGAGGIGAHIFHLPALALAAVAVADVHAGLHGGHDLLLQPAVGQAEVDEARAGNGHLADGAVGGQMLGQWPRRRPADWCFRLIFV